MTAAEGRKGLGLKVKQSHTGHPIRVGLWATEGRWVGDFCPPMAKERNPGVGRGTRLRVDPVGVGVRGRCQFAGLLLPCELPPAV